MNKPVIEFYFFYCYLKNKFIKVFIEFAYPSIQSPKLCLPGYHFWEDDVRKFQNITGIIVHSYCQEFLGRDCHLKRLLWHF